MFSLRSVCYSVCGESSDALDLTIQEPPTGIHHPGPSTPAPQDMYMVKLAGLLRPLFEIQDKWGRKLLIKILFQILLNNLKDAEQECIPVGCVPSAAVAVCWGVYPSVLIPISCKIEIFKILVWSCSIDFR